MVDTTFHQMNDSKDKNQFGPVQNLFKQEPGGLPPPSPRHQLTPTRPKTALEIAAEDKPSGEPLDGRKSQDVGGRPLKIRSQSSQISDNAANKLNHLNNVEYICSDESASTPPKQKVSPAVVGEFRRGGYLDEMFKQNQTLTKNGIKIESLKINIPTNDLITYPWKNDHKQQQMISRDIQPPQFLRDRPPQLPDFDYMGGKFGGTHSSFQMQLPQRNDFANSFGGYNTFQRATQQFGTNTFTAGFSAPTDNLQKDIQRVDPFYQTQQRNLNKFAQEETPQPPADYTFSLKDAMQRSMNLARQSLQQNQQKTSYIQQPMAISSQNFYQTNQPQAYSFQMNQLPMQKQFRPSGGFEKVKVYPPSPQREEYTSNSIAQIQMIHQQKLIQNHQKQASSHIRSISVSKEERKRRMEDLKLNFAVMRA